MKIICEIRQNYERSVDDNYNSYQYNTEAHREEVSMERTCRAESVSSQGWMRRGEVPDYRAQSLQYSYHQRSDGGQDNMSVRSEYQPQAKASYHSSSNGRELQYLQQGRPDLGRLPRPRNRNSNILSSILCLIKEIDGPSLEVVEMAVRCRMEELED